MEPNGREGERKALGEMIFREGLYKTLSRRLQLLWAAAIQVQVQKPETADDLRDKVSTSL